MKTLVLAAAITTFLTLTVVDAKCKNKKVKKFDWCRANGYEPTIDGCLATGEGTMKKKKTNQCVKAENALKKCDYKCNDPVDGGWSDFGEWSECSAECGGGAQTRTKTCTNPVSANGGKECEGDNMETKGCNNEACEVQTRIADAWEQIPGQLTRISKGNSGVWGVNSNDNIFKLNVDGKSWNKISGGLAQVASGASVWGVNGNDHIYKYLGDNTWQNIGGKLTNVDVSNKDHVWGINRDQKIFRRTESSWQLIEGKLIQISVGESGVWGVNEGNNIFYRQGTYGDTDTDGSGWTNVPGKLQWVASGLNLVVGINAGNEIFYRHGITAENPIGLGWIKVPGKLMQIDVNEDEVVGTNSGHNIFRSPVGLA